MAVTDKDFNKKIILLSQKAKNTIEAGLVFGIISGVIDWLIYYYWWTHWYGKMLVFLISLFVFLCIMVFFSGLGDFRYAKKKEMLEEIAQREEQEYQGIKLTDREMRAEKMFRMNQSQLMRYYDLNINHMKFLSILGVGLIIVGAIIIVVCLTSYSLGGPKMAFLIVGSGSGIFLNFIGAIFIKMYIGNIKTAETFHSILAGGNNLLLANSIANKIEDKEKREDTLADIAKEITKRGH